MTWDLLRRSVTHGVVPGLAGGPWVWGRWAPASPWAVPPTTVKALGWLVLAAALGISLARKQRIAPVWLTAAGYVVACQVPIYLMRSSRFTVLELAQTLRYFPDLVVVLALLAAVGFCAPNRASSGWLDASATRTVVTTAVAASFVASSWYSTATFLTSWRDNPAQPYLQNTRRDLAAAQANSSAPLLDQEVDPLVLGRVAWPDNLASRMFALLRDRPEFSSSTMQLKMLDGQGRLVGAQVTWVRAMAPGPVPQCGYLVQPDRPVEIGLDGPLLPADWTAEIKLSGQQRRVGDGLTVGGARRPGPRTSRAQPGLRATTGRGQCDAGAGQHGCAERVHRRWAGGIRAAALTRGKGGAT